jgi:hypothetical protein
MTEFDELQKIWDTQNNKPMYTINEQALQSRILSKTKQALHKTNISELLLILVNISAGGFILSLHFSLKGGEIFMYVIAAWMFATTLYLLQSRLRRLKDSRRFDRTMHGQLAHGISTAAYQVRLSQLMRWNILPVGALTLLCLWETQKPLWTIGLILAIFALGWYTSFWEHSYYKAKRRELEQLQKKLENDDGND